MEVVREYHNHRDNGEREQQPVCLRKAFEAFLVRQTQQQHSDRHKCGPKVGEVVNEHGKLRIGGNVLAAEHRRVPHDQLDDDGDEQVVKRFLLFGKRHVAQHGDQRDENHRQHDYGSSVHVNSFLERGPKPRRQLGSGRSKGRSTPHRGPARKSPSPAARRT